MVLKSDRIRELVRCFALWIRDGGADSSGNVAIVFALLVPVFVTVAGMAVDTARVEASKWSMQRSLDAAALGAAKEYGRTTDRAEIEKWANAIFFANEGRDPADNTQVVYEGVSTVDGSNRLRLSATRDEPTYFGRAIKALTGGAIDRETWPLAVSTEIFVKNRSIEMVLVLDNSGSMGQPAASGGPAKIVTLRTATEDLVRQMLAPQTEANSKDPVRLAVVPFSGAVNIGSRHANAAWMDRDGISPAHHDDLDWTSWKVLGIPQAVKGPDGVWRHITSLAPLNRFYLFDKLKAKAGPVWGWSGCVQSRPEGLAVTDETPTTAKPSSLFVPLFSPSEYNWGGTLTSVKNAYIPESTSGGTDSEALARQRDVNKYIGTASFNRSAPGPNALCNTTAITPLTSTQSTVLSAVTAMQPLGGTNIAEGLGWGWRALSSGAPFTEGRPRNTRDNLKALVLMTDGENTYNASYSNGQQIELTNANRSQFGTFGYGQFVGANGTIRTSRIFESTKAATPKAAIGNITEAMNESMSILCENIKKDGVNDDGGDGVVIFTIAFDLKDGSPVKERLRRCASNGIDGKGDKLYYDAKGASDLVAAFGAITDEISSLRISR